MKTISVLTVIFTFCNIIFLVSGCPDPIQPPIKTDPNVTETFPEFLIGSWKADNSRWGLTFDHEGKLTSMVHHGGMTFLDVSQGILEEDWRDGIKAVYILGTQPIAKYDPSARELSIHITIEHYQITFPDGSLEGSFEDTLAGPVLPDNQTWNTVWRSTGTIIGAPVTDPNDAVLIKTETFRKLNPEIIK